MTPPLLALLLLSSWGQAADVRGLRAGESVRDVGALPEVSEEEHAQGLAPVVGRVLDARTGRPVEGAALEAWTENLARDGVLIDMAITTTDGTYRLAPAADGLRAEKVRVGAAGYRMSTVSLSDARGELVLFPEGRPTSFRIRDLSGAPVPDALVRTHQTCSHAPAAVIGKTDQLGQVSFVDFPALNAEADIEVWAPGHGSLQYLSPERHLPLAGFESAGDVYVPRRLPIHLRVLNLDGQPAALRRVVMGGSPEWRAAWTAQDGALQFESTFDDREIALAFGDDKGTDFVAAGPFPRHVEVAVRVGGEDFEARAGDPNVGLVALAAEVPSALRDGDVPVRLFHDDGWTFAGLGEHVVPAGRFVAMLGAAFSGVEESVFELEVAPGGSARPELRPIAEPVLDIRLPDDGWWTVHVQADDDSVTRVVQRGGQLVQSVPRGSDVTVVASSHAVWRLALGTVDEDAVADLGEDGERLQARWYVEAPDLVEPARVRVRAVDRTNRPIPVEGSMATVVFDGRDDLDPAPDALAYSIPAGAPYEIECAAEGYVSCYVSGVAPGPAETRPYVATLPRRASLTLTGDLAAATLAGEDASPTDGGGLRLAELPPGPSNVRVVMRDGRRFVLELNLRDGETRTLQLR